MYTVTKVLIQPV